MLIRSLQPSDLDDAIVIADANPTAPHWPRSAYESALLGASVHRIAIAAEENHRLTGFAIANLIAQEAELETLTVAPAYHRQGIAQSLLQTLARQLTAHGAHTLFLEVRASNQPAIALYRKLGFYPSGTRLRYYSDPVEDAHFFTLPLS